ncbi:MAG: tail fiber domain-containing protein [bacterium]
MTQLNGYSFTWKDTGKKDIGLIAQEVEKIFPDLVNTDTDGVKAVEYMNIIAPLVESVKSLYQENITLKA